MTERAPYDYEMPVLRRGNRVGWVDRNGVMRTDIVADHREDPPGSGNYVTEIEGLPRWAGRAGDLQIHPDGSATWTVPVTEPEPMLPQADWDAAAADDEPRDILDDIDAVLDVGEQEIWYDYDDRKYLRCPRGCGRPWHGMAVTVRIEQMRLRHAMDPDYRYDQDDSEVLCPAPDFIGPHMSPYVARRRDTNFAVSIEAEARRRMRAYIERTWAQIWELLMPGEVPLDAARWFDPPRETEQRAPVDCSALRFVDASEFRPRLLPWQRDVLTMAFGEPTAGQYPPQYPRRATSTRRPLAQWLARGIAGHYVLIDECLPEPDPVTEAAAEAVREHDRPAVEPEAAARAALDARPIRIPGARPIPREPEPDPVQQAVTRAIRTNRRR